MKYAIRALGWATAALWILVILFSGTVVYSAMHIGFPELGKPTVTPLNGAMTISFPFSISNGGLYDISELNITTFIAAENETVSRSTTTVPLISRGDTVNKTHDISVSLDDILDKNLTYMLFRDTNLSVNMFVALTYAQVIHLNISSSLDEALYWGAPLNNLTIGETSFTAIGDPPYNVTVPLSFENHAFFGLNGTINLEIMDSLDTLIGSGTTDILVQPESGPVIITIPVMITGDPSDVAEARLYFDTSIFSFGPVVIPIE